MPKPHRVRGYLAPFECEGLAKVRVHGARHRRADAVRRQSPRNRSSIFSVGPYLGELAPGYTPLVNPPAFEEGEEPVGVLLTELNGPETGNTWQPEGGLPVRPGRHRCQQGRKPRDLLTEIER